MPKLPVLKPKEIIVILKKHGFLEKRQKGSHVLFVNQKINKWTTVPVHNKPLKKGTLKSILRQANISVNAL